MNYIHGVARIPRGFDRVKRVRFLKDAVEFIADSGKAATTSVRHSFIGTGEI